MAKKAVASMQKGEGRGFSKVIKMVKSPKTGAYIFAEEIVLNEKVKDYFHMITSCPRSCLRCSSILYHN